MVSSLEADLLGFVSSIDSVFLDLTPKISPLFLGRFKDNGRNFHVKLRKDKQNSNVLPSPNVSVPEDLVQIQAYLRWERKGKQAYSPEKEKASVIL